MAKMGFSEYMETLGADRQNVDRLKTEMIEAVEEYKLKEIRKTLGMTQTALASAAGISQNRVSDIENGRTSSLRIGTLSRYADALGCDVEIRITPRKKEAVAFPAGSVRLAVG